MEGLKPWRAAWQIEKYRVDSPLYLAKRRLELYRVEKFDGNIALRSGIAHLWDLIIGGSSNHFAEGATDIGVGNSSTAAADTQTALQGASTHWEAADTGYPTTATTTFTDDTFHVRATFEDGDAEFEWLEIAARESTGNKLMNRKVISAGTKGTGDIWIADLKIAWPTS